MKIVGGLLLAGVVLFAQAARPVEEFKTSAGPVKVTIIRHASMLIEAGGKTVYVDPWGQGKFDGLPKNGLIFVTHIHPDHFDQKGLDQVKREGTGIIAPAAL